MTLPQYVDSGTVASGTGDIVPGLPTGLAQGHYMLMEVECARGDSQATPAGWTPRPDSPVLTTTAGTGPHKLYLFEKFAGASESAPTVAATTDHHIAKIHAFSGVDVASIDTTYAFGNAVAGTTLTATGLTTPVADCLIVICVGSGVDTSTGQFSGYTNASLANVTEQADNFSSAGDGGGFGMATGEKAVAGVVSSTTVTLAGSSKQTFYTLALQPVTSTLKTIAVSATMTPAVVRSVAHVTAATVTASVSIVRSAAHVAGAAVTATPTVVKSTLHKTAAALTGTPAVVKRALHVVALDATLITAVAKSTGKAIAAGLALTVIVVRGTTRTVAIAMSFTVSAVRSAAHGLEIGMTAGVGLAKLTGKAVALGSTMAVEVLNGFIHEVADKIGQLFVSLLTRWQTFRTNGDQDTFEATALTRWSVRYAERRDSK